jgi:hypothetical protein
MRAMEKDRTRRYGSPAELAADIQRHLRDEPVVAGPPGTTYRLRKFIRRHRLGVAAGSFVAAAALAGIAGTTIGMVEARREVETARTVSRLLAGVFAALDPGGVTGDATSTQTVLDRGAERVAVELEGQPLVQADLMQTIGSVYRGLGSYERAQPLLEESYRLRVEILGEYHPQVASCCASLFWVHYWSGEYAMAQSMAERALAIRTQVYGEEDFRVAESLALLGRVLWRTGDLEGSRVTLERSVEICQKLPEENDVPLSHSLYALRVLLLELGDLDRAKEVYGQALEIRRQVFGPRHHGTTAVLTDRLGK